MKLIFRQTRNWPLPGVSPYSKEHCCYCGRYVDSAAAKCLYLARTNDGEWYAVSPDYRPADDDYGDGVFALPIGPDCLLKHPEWNFAIKEN